MLIPFKLARELAYYLRTFCILLYKYISRYIIMQVSTATIIKGFNSVTQGDAYLFTASLDYRLLVHEKVQFPSELTNLSVMY